MKLNALPIIVLAASAVPGILSAAVITTGATSGNPNWTVNGAPAVDINIRPSNWYNIMPTGISWIGPTTGAGGATSGTGSNCQSGNGGTSCGVAPGTYTYELSNFGVSSSVLDLSFTADDTISLLTFTLTNANGQDSIQIFGPFDSHQFSGLTSIQVPITIGGSLKITVQVVNSALASPFAAFPNPSGFLLPIAFFTDKPDSNLQIDPNGPNGGRPISVQFLYANPNFANGQFGAFCFTTECQASIYGIPEPSTYGLWITGSLAFLAARLRRRK